MSNMSERKLLIVTIAVSVLLTGVLLYFVFSYRSEIDGVNEEIDGLDARLPDRLFQVVSPHKSPSLWGIGDKSCTPLAIRRGSGRFPRFLGGAGARVEPSGPALGST